LKAKRISNLHLKECKNLEVLDLDSSYATNVVFSQLPVLQEISFTSQRVSNLSISQLPCLLSLNMEKSQITNLYLDSQEVELAKKIKKVRKIEQQTKYNQSIGKLQPS
jgi:hypothetical protein